MSLAGAAAAQARREAGSTLGYYNLRVGPTLWRFGAGLGLEYDDNITLTENSQQSDFLYRPSITTQLLWPITDKQRLNLSISAGYSGYFQHSTLNHFFVTPDSGLSFDIFAGDFLINLHDRFSISETSYQDPTVTGNGGYSQFQNTLGISTLWDLNKAVVNVGYDHNNYVALTGGQGQPDRSSETFSASAGYTPRAGVLWGVEVGGGLLHNSATSTNAPYTESTEWNAGPFLQAQISEHISIKANAGYTENSPQSGSLGTAADFSGIYAVLTITHRVNRFVDYSLSGGRTLNSSLFGGSIDLYRADLSANWKIFEKTTFTTTFHYQHGTQVVSNGETFDQYGPEISIGRTIVKNLSSNLRYQFYARGSDVPGRDYTVNVVTLDLVRQF